MTSGDFKTSQNGINISIYIFLYSFYAAGLVEGRASANKKLSGGMLAWLCVWVKVQICIWPS